MAEPATKDGEELGASDEALARELQDQENLSLRKLKSQGKDEPGAPSSSSNSSSSSKPKAEADPGQASWPAEGDTVADVDDDDQAQAPSAPRKQYKLYEPPQKIQMPV